MPLNSHTLYAGDSSFRQSSRIQGVRAADITVLTVYLEKLRDKAG